MTEFGTSPHKLVRATDPDTSKEAAYLVDTTKLEQQVFLIIKQFGEMGCIQDEVLGFFVGYPYSSVTARFRGLLDKRLIIDTGQRRKGKSGRSQRVLRAIV